MADKTPLEKIYDRLHDAPTYHPFTADTFSDWSMEAGDMITVTREGNEYHAPVHSSTLTWRGQPQINVNSEGNEKRDAIAKATKRKYTRGGNGYRNEEGLWKKLYDDYNGLASFFEFTAQHLEADFKGMYDGLSSHFEITRSKMEADFEDAYNGLSSAFVVTASEMSASFESAYTGLASEFAVTASEMRADFEDAYNGLASAFVVTASEMSTSFNNAYTGMSSALVQTASSLTSKINNVYSGLSSSLEQTESSLTSQINSYYSGLTSYIEQTVSSITLDAESIIVGENGTSNVYLSDVVSIQTGGGAVFKKPSVFQSNLYVYNHSLDNVIVDLQYALVSADVVNGSNKMSIKDAQGNETTIEVSGNSLVFKDKDNHTFSFSKATTLGGEWSGTNDKIQVTASPQDVNYEIGFGTSYGTNDMDLNITINGVASKDSSVASAVVVPIKVIELTGAQSEPTTRYTRDLTVSVANLLTSITPTTTGTKTPDSTHIGFSSVVVQASASASELLWNGESQKFYNKGYAYLGGSTAAAAESATRETQTITIGSDEWSGANKKIWVHHGANEILWDTITATATASAAEMTWDGTSKFYTYGYAYLNGSSQAAATSPIRETQEITIGSDAWEGNTKEIWVKHGATKILTDTIEYSGAAYDLETNQGYLYNDGIPDEGWSIPSGRDYQIKDNTSGTNAEVKHYYYTNPVVDGEPLNADHHLLNSSTTVDTQIYRDAYSAGFVAGGGGAVLSGEWDGARTFTVSSPGSASISTTLVGSVAQLNASWEDNVVTLNLRGTVSTAPSTTVDVGSVSYAVANLSAGNVKKGTVIGGVTGSYEGGSYNDGWDAAVASIGNPWIATNNPQSLPENRIGWGALWRVGITYKNHNNVDQSKSLVVRCPQFWLYQYNGQIQGELLPSGTKWKIAESENGDPIGGSNGVFRVPVVPGAPTVNTPSMIGQQTARAGQSVVDAFISGAERVFGTYTITKDGSYSIYFKFRVSATTSSGTTTKTYYFKT